MDVQLSQMEQELLVLELVKACLQEAKDSGRTFQEVLGVDVFVEKADNGFEQMVCSTIESLHKQGVITGTVEIAYETLIDAESFEESQTDQIDVPMCTFEDIAVNMGSDKDVVKKGYKEVGKDYWVKVKPVLACIGKTALQTTVSLLVKAGLNAVGIMV